MKMLYQQKFFTEKIRNISQTTYKQSREKKFQARRDLSNFTFNLE